MSSRPNTPASGGLMRRMRKLLGMDESIHVEVDGESLGLAWSGAAQVPAVVAFFVEMILRRENWPETRQQVRLALLASPEDGGEILVAESSYEDFVHGLSEFLRVAYLDTARLEWCDQQVSFPIRFEGTAAHGLAVLFLDHPKPENIRAVADALTAELGGFFSVSV